MGFSTGGSAALLALGLFIAFGTFQAATTERLEHVTDAKHVAGEDRLDRINTEITITRADWIETGNRLEINASNNGSTALRIEDVDVIVDGDYITADEMNFERVDGTDTDRSTTGVSDTTGLWLPGQEYAVEILRLELDLSPTESPDRVKIVVEVGVSDSKGVS